MLWLSLVVRHTAQLLSCTRWAWCPARTAHSRSCAAARRRCARGAVLAAADARQGRAQAALHWRSGARARQHFLHLAARRRPIFPASHCRHGHGPPDDGNIVCQVTHEPIHDGHEHPQLAYPRRFSRHRRRVHLRSRQRQMPSVAQGTRPNKDPTLKLPPPVLGRRHHCPGPARCSRLGAGSLPLLANLLSPGTKKLERCDHRLPTCGQRCTASRSSTTSLNSRATVATVLRHTLLQHARLLHSTHLFVNPKANPEANVGQTRHTNAGPEATYCTPRPGARGQSLLSDAWHSKLELRPPTDPNAKPIRCPVWHDQGRHPERKGDPKACGPRGPSVSILTGAHTINEAVRASGFVNYICYMILNAVEVGLRAGCCCCSSSRNGRCRRLSGLLVPFHIDFLCTGPLMDANHVHRAVCRRRRACRTRAVRSSPSRNTRH